MKVDRPLWEGEIQRSKGDYAVDFVTQSFPALSLKINFVFFFTLSRSVYYFFFFYVQLF